MRTRCQQLRTPAKTFARVSMHNIFVFCNVGPVNGMNHSFSERRWSRYGDLGLRIYGATLLAHDHVKPIDVTSQVLLMESGSPSILSSSQCAWANATISGRTMSLWLAVAMLVPKPVLPLLDLELELLLLHLRWTIWGYAPVTQASAELGKAPWSERLMHWTGCAGE